MIGYIIRIFYKFMSYVSQKIHTTD